LRKAHQNAGDKTPFNLYSPMNIPSSSKMRSNFLSLESRVAESVAKSKGFGGFWVVSESDS